MWVILRRDSISNWRGNNKEQIIWTLYMNLNGKQREYCLLQTFKLWIKETRSGLHIAGLSDGNIHTYTSNTTEQGGQYLSSREIREYPKATECSVCPESADSQGQRVLPALKFEICVMWSFWRSLSGKTSRSLKLSRGDNSPSQIDD